MKDINIQNKYHHKFSAMIQASERDPELKNEVMSTISRLDSIMEIVDLFSSQFVLSNSTMLDNIYKSKNKY